MSTEPIKAKTLASLTDFATVVAILGAIVYWIGWFFSIQYFSYFGAIWFVDMLDTRALLANSYIVSTSFITLTAVFCTAYAKSKRIYGWLCLAALSCLIAAGTIPISESVSSRFIPGLDSFLGGAGMLGFAASIIAAKARPPFTELKTYLEPAYLGNL